MHYHLVVLHLRLSPPQRGNTHALPIIDVAETQLGNWHGLMGKTIRPRPDRIFVGPSPFSVICQT
jgi:hypothetical protein